MRERPDDAELERLIRQELDLIKDPCSLASGVPLGLDEMGLIDTVAIAPDGAVSLRMRLTAPFCHMIGYFQTETVRRVSALPGVTAVTLVPDTGLDWSPGRISATGQAKRAAHLERMREAAAGRRAA